MDWIQYWFIFPISICIATTAMLSGIGGAALFIPIFVIIFPILGLEYPLTTVGGFLTGLLGVGIGEVIMPQLVKRNHVPVPVAAATSVFIVIVTIASASFTQVTALMAAGGSNAIPWNLVCYTIPAVIIGGQIGPWLQGRIAQWTMEKSIAILFGVIGVVMGWIMRRGFG